MKYSQRRMLVPTAQLCIQVFQFFFSAIGQGSLDMSRVPCQGGRLTSISHFALVDPIAWLCSLGLRSRQYKYYGSLQAITLCWARIHVKYQRICGQITSTCQNLKSCQLMTALTSASWRSQHIDIQPQSQSTLLLSQGSSAGVP